MGLLEARTSALRPLLWLLLLLLLLAKQNSRVFAQEMIPSVVQTPSHLSAHLQRLQATVPAPRTPAQRHFLLASNVTSNSHNTTCSCCSTCQAPGSTEELVVASQFFGWMPFLRHSIYNLRQQLLAQSSHGVVTLDLQQFSTALDLTPLQQLYPGSSMTYYEHLKPSRSIPYFSPVPSFASAHADAPVSVAELNGGYYNMYIEILDVLNTQPVMLVYRHDVLKLHGLPVPETWQQLLAVAGQLNGTDFNGDKIGDNALCVDVDPNCKSYWLFAAVAASILQPNGTSSGFLIDPATGQQLIGSGGMTQALHLWRSLMSFNAPEQSSKPYCSLWEAAFSEGRCLFTLGYAQVHGNDLASYAHGRTGVAPTPGSLEVWDRSRGAMVPCDAVNCPYSTPLQTPLPGAAAAAVPAVPAPRVNRAPVICSIAIEDMLPKGTSPVLSAALINSVAQLSFRVLNWPILSLSGTYFLAEDNLNAYSLQGFNLSSVNTTFFSGASFLRNGYAWVQSLNNQTQWDPYDVQPGVEKALFLAPAQFYEQDLTEASAHMRAWVWSAMHPNVAVDAQGVALLRALVADVVKQSLQGVTDDSILADITYKMGPTMWGMIGPALWTLDLYKADLGYRPPSDPPPSASPPPPAGPPLTAAGTAPSEGLSQSHLLLAIILPVSVLLVVGGLLVYAWMDGSRLDVFGEVRAPGLGASTSLVVTDIQNSTFLWESLPQAVMDTAISTHHIIMRQLLKKHRGYEICTEGDSFSIMFYTPVDALSYCLEVQAALNAADWPQELLDMEESAGAGLVHVMHQPNSLDWLDVGSSATPDREAPLTLQSALTERLSSALMCRAPSVAIPRSPTSSSKHTDPGGGLSLRSARTPSTLGTPTSPTVDLTLQTSHSVNELFLLTPDKSQELVGPVAATLADAKSQELVVTGPAVTLRQWLEREVQVVGDEAGWLAQLSPPVPGRAALPGSVLLFRGLRVRMGLHCGLTDAHHWNLNKMTRRWCASGHFLALTKAISDIAAGGMILLSPEAMSFISRHSRPKGAKLALLHLGEHQMTDLEGSFPVYCAFSIALVARLAVCAPLRSVAMSAPGVLAAPMGAATVVFMHAVGVKMLQQWDEGVAKGAVQLYQEVLTRTILQWDGYIAELGDGLCLAAFSRPSYAIGWALCCQSELLVQNWDPRLLKHELCEEVSVVVKTLPVLTPSAALLGGRRSNLSEDSMHSPPPAAGRSLMHVSSVTRDRSRDACVQVQRKTVLRGLRIKVGMADGAVNNTVSPTTGCMEFRGKVMNRAARIAGFSRSSQVLCSASVWTAGLQCPRLQLQPVPIIGCSLGKFSLKGVRERVEVVECRFREGTEAVLA